MKHFILILALILSAGSLTMCRQERAEALVKEFFEERADEYAGYEPVSFGKLQAFYRDPNFIPPARDFHSWDEEEEEEVLETPPLSPNELKFAGWDLTHTFRILNESGTAELQEMLFSFDKGLTRITDWKCLVPKP